MHACPSCHAAGPSTVLESDGTDVPPAPGDVVICELCLSPLRFDATLRLRELTGQPVRGWLSPGKLNSPNTPDLIANEGVEYFCDWVNDELPYRWNVASGELWSMPLSTEISDTFTLVDNLHSEESWADQVCDAADLLHAEAADQGGRILTLTLTPWLLGQPHRMKHLERVLDHVTSLSGVWSASGSQILDAA